jgi:hypothetical protein
MHHPILAASFIGIFLLACCKGGHSTPEVDAETGAPPAADQLKSSEMETIPAGEPKRDPEYGMLDGDGYPTDPGFAMNSSRIDGNQRAELRQSPPGGYHVTALLNPRIINRKDEGIAWRPVSAEPSEDLAAFMQSLKAGVGIPEGLYPDDEVRFSPSRKRILVGSSSRDRWQIFAMGEDGWDMNRGLKVRSVTFDDKWRWFIDWKYFLTESKIVGISITDDEIEAYPEQHRLYTYDIDRMMLTRVRLPVAIQPRGFEFFQIEAISPAAVLLRIGYEEGRRDDLFTVYLDANE